MHLLSISPFFIGTLIMALVCAALMIWGRPKAKENPKWELPPMPPERPNMERAMEDLEMAYNSLVAAAYRISTSNMEFKQVESKILRDMADRVGELQNRIADVNNISGLKPTDPELLDNTITESPTFHRNLSASERQKLQKELNQHPILDRARRKDGHNNSYY